MKTKKLFIVSLALTLATGPVTQARADADGIVGGIIGGIIGGAIVNEGNKQRRAQPQRTYRKAAPTARVSSAQREANRDVQVALNHFGFPAGTPDGALGPRSRSAISEYQALLGYTPTGQLTEYERTLLVGSYHRAIAGGGMTMQQAAANPMGMKGLLISWRDEAAGIKPPGTMAMAPIVPAVPALQGTPALPQFAATETPEPEPEPAPVPAVAGLPSFMSGGTAQQASLASHCNKVNLVTSTNGGFTTLASMSDANQALSEQFCLARTYAITQGEDLAAKISGATPQEIAAQCSGLAPAMKDQIAALSLKPREAVMSDVSAFALGSGMAPAQLSGTAKVCLSVGYRTDDMNVALSSALLLTALGEPVYGELLGHHLAMGFGTSRRPDLAMDWYQTGFDAVGAGTTPVFAPGQPERNELIRKAAWSLGGRS